MSFRMVKCVVSVLTGCEAGKNIAGRICGLRAAGRRDETK